VNSDRGLGPGAWSHGHNEENSTQCLSKIQSFYECCKKENTTNPSHKRSKFWNSVATNGGFLDDKSTYAVADKD
jgi:hypothetical protein